MRGLSMWLVAGLLLLTAPAERCFAADGKPDVVQAPAEGVEFPADITGLGTKMNYGPFLTYSVIHVTGKTAHVTPKAITVRASRSPVVAVCFDPDTLRVAAAWTGGYLNIGKTNLNGYKGDDLAHELPHLLFSTRPGPGWTADEAAAGKYRGLYLHGERVIFAYSIGKTDVLDSFEATSGREGTTVLRTLRVGPHATPLTLLVFESTTGPAETDGSIATATTEDAVVAAGTRGLPAGATLMTPAKGRVVVRLPAADRPVSFQVAVWHGAKADVAKFKTTLAAKGEVPDLTTLCQGGPRRWPEPVQVMGKPGTEPGAYVVDDIPLPDRNPWGSWMRPGALDFFPDGRAAVCTWSGDVWIVSGLDAELKAVRWSRFATGLFEPLGLKIVDGKIYALAKDRITRLHDLNKDGEADFYESFNADAPAAPTFHDFAMELHTDREGNFYYSRGGHRVVPGFALHNGIVKVAKDGSKSEVIATGFREANGMCVGPDGTITVADNQGNWVPTAKIDIIKPGRFYGYNWGTELKDYEKPLCWIPHTVDNSCGGQAWVTSDRWGPFRGHLLHTSYGTCKLFLVMTEKVGDVWQGGVVEFPLGFRSGIMRARFNPADGQLYVCGLKGWGTKAKDDGCFQRVRYTGKPVHMPKGVRVSKGELHLDFTCPLDPASVAAAGAFAVQRWNYVRAASYGSKDYSVAEPKKVGRDSVPTRATLSADRKTVTLAIPDLAPVMQMGTTVNVKAADGTPMKWVLYNTINRVP